MNLHFEPDFDSGAWPGPLAKAQATFGEAWVGTQRLLAILETQLGLSAPVLGAAERIGALLKPLANVPGFHSGSYEVDPIGVARALLHLRDELALSGWVGQVQAGRLGLLHQLTSGAPPGLPDRLAAIVRALELETPEVRSLTVYGARSDFPHLWRALFDALEKRGTAVHFRPELPVVTSEGDLGAIRLAAPRTWAPQGDGSLQLIRPHGVRAAAEEVAAWLASERDLSGVVVIGPDALLDAALHRFSVPTLGGPRALADEALLQLLPLVLELGVSPPDPAAALQLLTLPSSPIPKAIALRLARALQEVPAVGSERWNEALEKGLAALDDDRRESVAERLEWLFRADVDAASRSYPVVALVRRAEALTKWARARAALAEANASESAAFLLAASHAEAFSAFVQATGASVLGPELIHRLVEEARRGLSLPSPFPAQAGLASIGHPAAMVGPADTVVFWNFTEHAAPRASDLALTEEEETALRAAGIHVPTGGERALREAQRFARPLLLAKSRLLLIAPRLAEDGREQGLHPLFDEIRARVQQVEQLSAVTGVAIKSPTPPNTIERGALPLPAPMREWTLPGRSVALREVESPSSLGRLVGCSLAYVLQYVGKLERGLGGELPSNKALLGSTVHALLAELLSAHPKLSPEDAEREALALFDAQAPKLAAPLYQPGNDGPLADARAVMGSSARQFYSLLESAGLEIQAVETTHETALEKGVLLRGDPDVVLARTSPGGEKQPVIVDFKWSGASYRQESLEVGTAYQLAAYSAMTTGGRADAPVGYFILERQRLLTTDGTTFGGVPALDGPGPRETFTALQRAVSEAARALKQGQFLASGVEGEEAPPLAEEGIDEQDTLRLSPPCQFCEYEGICGRGFGPSEEAAS
ncbi:MAG: PD-(D/E)XK nuclease family protein [Myxococcaceae bacterium]